MELAAAAAPVHRIAPRASTRERPPLRLVGSRRRPAASGRPRRRPPRLSATSRCSASGAGSHFTVEDDLGALLQVSSLPLSPPDNFRRIRRRRPLFLVSGHRSLIRAVSQLAISLAVFGALRSNSITEKI